MLSAAQDALDEHGLINIDLPCLVCSYNLRMQPHDGKCPECGAPVVQTADSRRL